MKYLILLILLLLFSCTEKEIDQSALKLGKIYTKVWYHMSTEDMAFKGPIKEIVYETYSVTGDTASFTIMGKDSLASLKDVQVMRFNQKGFMTYIQVIPPSQLASFDGKINSSYSELFYNANEVIDSVISSMKRIPLDQNGSGEELLATQQTTFTFNNDTLTMIMRIKNSEVVDRMLLSLDDGIFSIRFFDGDTIDSCNYKHYKNGPDAVFRTYEVAVEGVNQLLRSRYQDSQCVEQELVTSNMAGDSTIQKITLDVYGNTIQTLESKGLLSGSPYDTWNYRYQYDKHNNWIEKVVFSKGKAVKAIRREITYYK